MTLDEQDLDVLKIYNIYVGKLGYAVAKNPDFYGGRYDRKDEYLYIHRIIAQRMHSSMLIQKDKVDHINGDKLDNRRGNLRVVNHKTNIDNRTKLNKNNSSGLRGVYFRKDVKKRPWQAQYLDRGLHISLGCYTTKEEAEEAVTKYRAEHVVGSQEYFKKHNE